MQYGVLQPFQDGLVKLFDHIFRNKIWNWYITYNNGTPYALIRYIVDNANTIPISHFNPLFLVFGYHFYYLNTTNNVQLFVITRKELKDPKSIKIEQLRRINNFTFIDIKK